MPRICSVYFPSPKPSGGFDYHRLVCALAASAVQNAPESRINIRVMRGKRMPESALKQSFTDNTVKLDEWRRFVHTADDGEVLLLMDCDMLVIGPLDSIEQIDFDVAWTKRPPRSKLPLNGGVVAIRVNERSRQFMDHWVDINGRMMRDTQMHAPWRRKYGGINQASFGYMLERCDLSYANVQPIPCHEWNCEDTTWHRFDPRTTRILHIKSRLRKACLGRIGAGGPAHLVKLWRQYDRLANEYGINFNGTSKGESQGEQAVGRPAAAVA